jgi:hypothetical protein
MELYHHSTIHVHGVLIKHRNSFTLSYEKPVQERVGVAVKPLICILKVHGSNPSRNTLYSDSDLSWLSSVLPDKFRYLQCYRWIFPRG